jgi:hypothetical protein
MAMEVTGCDGLPMAIFLTFTMFTGNLALQGKDPPSDACVMLSAAQLEKALEQPFGPPAKTTAPAAPQDRVTGTDCTYQSGKGILRKLLFRIYLDPSAAVAKETFEQLSIYFKPNTAVTGNWDTAYLDANHAIHVQKGKVRYYLNLNPVGMDTAKADKQLKDLATWVAGQL